MFMRIIMIILIFCLPVFAQVNAKEVQVQVNTMDIYPRGAKVIFAVDAAANMSFQLPAAFELDSVRPIYSQGITVDYFQKAFISKNDAVPDTLKTLYNTIKTKEEELAKLSARITAANDQLKMLMNISNRDIVAANPADYVKSLLNYYVEASTEINIITNKQAELAAELKRLQEDYKKRLPANNDRLIDITMGVRGNGKVLIEAYSPNAGWTPSYKINLDSKTGELKSILVAQAYQQTGLNYNGAINFNTQALPRGSMVIPKPKPLVVDFQQTADTSRVFRNSVATATAPAAPAAPATVEIMTTESLTNFTVAGRGNILGDGTAVAIDLGAQSMKAKLKVILVRDYSQDGHLVVTLEKIADPFMQGNAELSVDGKTSGQTHIANYGRGEDVEIAFGYMPLVKVNKITDVSKTGSSGLISKDGTLDEGYELEVVNGSSLAMDIELIDRLPYSANEKIAIENIVIEPAASTNKENVLTWKMNLKAGETKKFKVSYRVKHPADQPVRFR